MKLRLLTWNINSLRLRMNLLREVVKTTRPDIVCLQEIKVEDRLFPELDCRGLGFEHIAFAGMKSYNGVAILSRLPLSNVEILSRCGRDDCRHIRAEVAGFDLHNLYIPAGGDIPDPAINDKFAHKLDFVKELAELFVGRDKKTVLVGDFNIAPLEHDVWSHKQLLDVVSHTPIEVELLAQFKASGSFVDVARHFVPHTEKLYSWWSYRAKDWEQANRGRRLDHIWVSPDLAPGLISFNIERSFRSSTQPSDHVPVILELEA
jgi:exodeoxyribonuclease-3